jgi:hypothetical protein
MQTEFTTIAIRFANVWQHLVWKLAEAVVISCFLMACVAILTETCIPG